MTTVHALQSTHLGLIEWEPEAELFLPAGLPGFESERRMIPIEIPAQRPLVFLQSAEDPAVCFVSLPVKAIDPSFELCLSEDDRSALLFDHAASPRIGSDVLCLALLLPAAGSMIANLSAPIVVNLHNSVCVQTISETPSRYYRLDTTGWEPVC